MIEFYSASHGAVTTRVENIFSLRATDHNFYVQLKGCPDFSIDKNTYNSLKEAYTHFCERLARSGA